MSHSHANTPDLDSEFAYHKYRLQVIEECRSNLAQVQESLEGVTNPTTLRTIALYFAKESFERCVELYDHTVVAGAAVAKYKAALRAVEVLLVLIVVTNLFTGGLLWLLLHH